MKKFLKWVAIVLGVLIVLIIIAIATVFISHDRYWFYSSGSVLSENQAKYDITFYDLNLEVHAQEQAISGFTAIKLKALADSLDRIELDLIDNFDVTAISDGHSKALDYEHNDDKLWIDLNRFINKDELINLKIEYNGHPIEALLPPWIGGFNWSTDSSGAHWIGVSCQGEGGKIWFPCKDHLSDKPDSVAINITVPESYYCASNGILRDVTKPAVGFRKYHWITRYPINNYNINISIGKYDIVENKYICKDGSVMPVYFYVLPQSREGAVEHLEMAIDMLYTYRKFYGEYPFTNEKFAIVQTDYLGMEHQTINAYGNNYHYRAINGKEFDWLMLHEMGHEWWGNKVTVEDWADFWIHEGICTYGEALYQLDKNGGQAYHDYMKGIKRKIRNDKPIIPKRKANASEVYHGDIYYKGAYLMHSLRFVLGDTLFFRTLKEFACDSANIYHSNVDTDDFIALINKNSGRDYSGFINSFLYTTDLPHVQIDSLGKERYQLSLLNVDFDLVMEVQLDSVVTKLNLGQDAVVAYSKEKPIVDPNYWYLKSSDIF